MTDLDTRVMLGLAQDVNDKAMRVADLEEALRAFLLWHDGQDMPDWDHVRRARELLHPQPNLL